MNEEIPMASFLWHTRPLRFMAKHAGISMEHHQYRVDRITAISATPSKKRNS